MDWGVAIPEAGRLGAGSRIDVSTEPPTITAVEYQLSGWARDDLMACGPVVLVSERLAERLERAQVRGVELVPAAMLPAPPDEFENDEPLPPDAPNRYRWLRKTDDDNPEIQIRVPEYLLVSARIAAILRDAPLLDADFVSPEERRDDPNGPRTGMTAPAVLCAYVRGTHGPRGFDGLPAVEASCTSDRDEEATFATVTDAIAWGRERAGQVHVDLTDGSWSAGTAPIPGVETLPEDVLRRADAQALAHREQGLAEILVQPEPQPWYVAIIAPDTTLPLDEAARLVRAVEGVDDLSRHNTAGGDPVWLITTLARGPDDLHALDGRIAEVLMTPDRFAHLCDGELVAYSTGRGSEAGLVGNLDLDGLLARYLGQRRNTQ